MQSSCEYTRESTIPSIIDKQCQVVDDLLEFDSEQVGKHLSSPAGKTTLRGEWSHGKSVSSAYWDPRGRSIVSTCYDDKLRCKFAILDYTIQVAMLIRLSSPPVWDFKPSIFDKDAKFPSTRPFAQLNHDCQTVCACSDHIFDCPC